MQTESGLLVAKSTGVTGAAWITEERVRAAPERSWAAALRMERWHDALRAIDLEPAEVRALPEVRYAAAAAAEKLGDASRVIEHLTDLESELPLLAERIRARRAEAAVATRQAQLALDYYRQRSDLESQLRVAQAQASLGDREAASASVSSLLVKLPKTASRCQIEAKARRLLSDTLPEGATSRVARELRWLAVQAPLCAASEGADQRLEALGGHAALTKSERLERARAFAAAGLVERTELELFAIRQARGIAPEASAILAIRGHSRYSARKELDRASELLVRAARGNRAREAEWLYAAARACIRAGATDRAVALLERVSRAARNAPLGEISEYKRAQLIYSAGRFDDAVRAYDAYLSRYGKRARFRAEAGEERSLAWVFTGRAERAAVSFAELARSAKRVDVARYRHLEAVAQLYAGKRVEAVGALRQVMVDHPLSFQALAAGARLRALGVILSPPPAETALVAVPDELLAELPAEAALLHRIGLDREAELALAEVERKVALAHIGQGQRALCGLYHRLASAERGYRVGRSAASWEELQGAPRPDRRWLWDCAYPRPYQELVQHSASDHGVETELIYAVMRQESAFRPEVISPAQAVGLLQILPITGEKLAGELGIPFEAEQLQHPPVNVRLGARYLRKLLDIFDGSLPLALASYNAGPSAVLHWLEGARNLELDLFVARIPYSETRSYVERVVSNYARYRYLSGGEAAIPQLSMKLPTPKTDGVELF